MRTRGIVAVLALVLQYLVLVLVAPPAQAAVTLVHSKTVTGSLSLPTGQELSKQLTCGSGWVAASSGFNNPQPYWTWRAYDYAEADQATWTWGFINGYNATVSIDLSLLCLQASDVGSVTVTSIDLPRNGTTGRAQNNANCASGTSLSPGLDWTPSSGDRNLLQEYPQDENTFSVGGYSATSGAVLHVDIRCITVDVGAVANNSSISTGTANTVQSIDNTCADGKRVLTGGVNQNGSVESLAYSSYPNGKSWHATIQHAPTTGTLQVRSICIPYSVPTVTLTGAPNSSMSNDATPTFRFTASDSVEQLSYTCNLDGVPVGPCAPDTDLTYTVSAGSHYYQVTATNQWTSTSTTAFYWQVDTTPPTVVGHQPATRLLTTDPFSVTFSESMSFALGSVTLAPTGGSSVAIQAPTSMSTPDGIQFTWQPTAPLIATQHYTVTLTSGVTDWSGNPIAPTSFEFQAYENVAPALVSKTTTLGITGPLSATFSEVVGGVTTSSFYLRADGTATNVPATVTTAVSGGKTTATLTTKAALVPGRGYTAYLTSTIKDTSDNALAGTSWHMRAPLMIQNDSPALTTRWDFDKSTRASGGSYATSRIPGSAATLTFTATAGQTAALYGIRLPTGGSAEIYLDGVKKTTVSTKASTLSRARLYLTPALTAGTHVLRFRVVSGWGSVDSATVGSTTYQEVSFRQSFRRVGATSAAGGTYDVAEHVTDSDSRPVISMVFTGTGIRLYATKTTASGRAYVYVDGTLISTINLYRSSTAYKQLVFSRTVTNGSHTISVQPVGTASGASSSVGVDYFQVV